MRTILTMMMKKTRTITSNSENGMDPLWQFYPRSLIINTHSSTNH